MKRRVALVCGEHLLGESLEHTLRHFEDVEMIGSWKLDDQVLALLALQTPDLLLIAEQEPPCEKTLYLTGQILDRYPNLPVMRVTLNQNVIRIYTARTLPARSTELIDLIRQIPVPEENRKGD